VLKRSISIISFQNIAFFIPYPIHWRSPLSRCRPCRCYAVSCVQTCRKGRGNSRGKTSIQFNLYAY